MVRAASGHPPDVRPYPQTELLKTAWDNFQSHQFPSHVVCEGTREDCLEPCLPQDRGRSRGEPGYSLPLTHSKGPQGQAASEDGCHQESRGEEAISWETLGDTQLSRCSASQGSPLTQPPGPGLSHLNPALYVTSCGPPPLSPRPSSPPCHQLAGNIQMPQQLWACLGQSSLETADLPRSSFTWLGGQKPDCCGGGALSARQKTRLSSA